MEVSRTSIDYDELKAAAMEQSGAAAPDGVAFTELDAGKADELPF